MRATSADGTGIDFEMAGDGSPLGASPPSSRAALMLSPSVPIRPRSSGKRTVPDGGHRAVHHLAGTAGTGSVLLAGDQDPRLPAIERTATQIPSATLVRLPGCGHLDTFARTDLTLPVVLPFLSDHTGHPRI
jgi:pimeloyl-ACP methyl ester carboxylesterase